MPMDSDHRPTAEQLLAEARQGKGEGLGTLLELYRNYLGLVARTQIDVHLRAQVNPSDVVQETFLEAYRDFQQFQGTTEREFLAWVRRILIHHLGRLVGKRIRGEQRDGRRLV